MFSYLSTCWPEDRYKSDTKILILHTYKYITLFCDANPSCGMSKKIDSGYKWQEPSRELRCEGLGRIGPISRNFQKILWKTIGLQRWKLKTSRSRHENTFIDHSERTVNSKTRYMLFIKNPQNTPGVQLSQKMMLFSNSLANFKNNHHGHFIPDYYRTRECP